MVIHSVNRLTRILHFQVVIRSVHRLSRILLTCPVQVHFRLLNCSITSVTFVFSLTQMFTFPSQYVMFNILLSIFVCAAACSFFACVVSARDSVPYVSAGSTHKLWTCLFKHVPMLPLKKSRCLANAVHPAVILL